MQHRRKVVDVYQDRREANIASRGWATRSGLQWTEEEDEFLIEFWINVDHEDRDEVTVSQCIERTIESCRVRCEHIRKRMGRQCFDVNKHATEYRGVEDDPEDQWWSPDYYEEG